MTPVAKTNALAFGVVILAAGQSSRMGTPKLLLPWGQTSVLGHLIEQWQKLGVEQVVVVSAAGDQTLVAELDRLGFAADNRVYNPAPDRGMFSSIQCAARWLGWKRSLTHWGIVLGDQPHLRPETLQALLAFSIAHREKICLPWSRGHRRHPVLLPKERFIQLADSTTTDLKEFLGKMAAEVSICESDDPGLGLDIDRPEEYQRAMALGIKEAKR